MTTDSPDPTTSTAPRRDEVLEAVLADLAAESDQLDALVADLDDAGWSRPTPAEGWTIAHQVAHLHWTDEASLAAVDGGEAFAALIKSAVENPAGYVDAEAERLAALAPSELLARWRDGRVRLADALRAVPHGDKIAWFGPPMSPASMATARLMETWAHGHDVAEALDVELPPTVRAKHVAYLGFRTRGFAYLVRGRDVPAAPVRLELVGPDGDTWAWGPEDAPDRVTGDGYDFALLATRRRVRDDVDVTAEGPAADEWLDIVQAFAGLPGPDPKPRGARGTEDAS
ncbi:TIGR03084 family protein [Mumia sp. zg.B21]|uniref:TIGR03084 family metal-binding protein n=1 Tax=unclassified Mumia TaxID=2621872 RepID=UPI001C6E569E|nr:MULTISPECIES: TIGR03084 family metal-binding protein [unclassified Mumia]MBW9209725.1 TIGR03084 family protein [Mumia sp. zg.B21]MDD9348402.1 TIGR03084 family metal-binding protein [Mumia sp.]